MTGALLRDAQRRVRDEARAFADAYVRPGAAAFDRDEALPSHLVERLAAAGYLGALVPSAHGGRPLDAVAYGLLNEEIGAACSSVRSLLTVHGMVCHAIVQCGSPEQKARWLPPLADGRTVGAFALSEPAVGSDASQVETTATPHDGGWLLRGRKKWTTFGQRADLFLVFARTERGPAAFLVEAAQPGLTRAPLRGLLGTRAAMLAELTLDGCPVAASHMLGGPGFGSTIAGAALDVGRYSVAWGCVGIGQACLDASEQYSRTRYQFGKPLAEHQLVGRMLTDMMTQVRAARLLCLHAGLARQDERPSTVLDTLMAKYFASCMAMRAASDAVQIHGANGCGEDAPVARYLRDAKIMEIIEGSTQIQQILIAGHARVDVERHRRGE